VHQHLAHASSPRVRRMMSSVLMWVVARPRIRLTSECPRAAPGSRLRSHTRSPSRTNSTSLEGTMFSASRMSRGMVTWPLDVMRMARNFQVFAVRVLLSVMAGKPDADCKAVTCAVILRDAQRHRRIHGPKPSTYWILQLRVLRTLRAG